MEITISQEHYLESILILSKNKPVVRAVDLANNLGFTRSSICNAMKKLKKLNYITITSEGFIYLTETGMEIANLIYEKHKILTEFLIMLGVPDKTAEYDACQIEHIISKETFDIIKNINKLNE